MGHLQAQLPGSWHCAGANKTVFIAWWRFYYLPFSYDSIDVVGLRTYRAI